MEKRANITDNEIVFETINYIKNNIKKTDEKRNILIVFNSYLTALDNIYAIEKSKNEMLADRYLKSVINVFIERLNKFIYSDGYPSEKVAYIKLNNEKFEENNPLNKKLAYLYNKIMFGDFSFEFYYEILFYANKNYDTVMRNINCLADIMGYNKSKPIYKDAHVNLEKYKSLSTAIKNVE